MKKLLLLFIPLVFLFSCSNIDNNINTPKYDCTVDGCIELDEGGRWWTLQDCEETCDCSCGEVVDFMSHQPMYWNGDSIVTLGEWCVSYIENYCTGNIGTYCGEFIGIGQSFCIENQSVFIQNYNIIDSIGCYDTGIDFY